MLLGILDGRVPPSSLHINPFHDIRTRHYITSPVFRPFTRVRTLYLGQVRSQHTVLAFCYCRLVLFDIAYPCTCRGEGAATRRLYFTLNVPNHLKLKTLLVDSHDVLMVLLKTMSDISP